MAAALGFLKWQDDPLDRLAGAYIRLLFRPRLYLYMPGLQEDPVEEQGRIQIEEGSR